MTHETERPTRCRLELLTLDPDNARKHDKRNLATIRASLERFGQRKNIVAQAREGKDGARELVVRAGNGLVIAMRELGWTTAKVEIYEESDDDARDFALVDNRSAELSVWDEMGLAGSLADALGTTSIEDGLDDLGFSSDDLRRILGISEDEGELPPPPETPVTERGDVWVLGRHRLLCGDSTVPAEVSRIARPFRPSLLVTDPPYGIEYDPAWRKEKAEMGFKRFKPSALGKVRNDDRADWEAAFRLFPGDVAYVWHASHFGGKTAQSLVNCGFKIRAQIIWKKSSYAISRGHYNWQHEPCWYAVRKGKTARWAGKKNESTVWDIPHVKNKTGLGAEKPIEIFARPMMNHGEEGDVVFDPFVGSGTAIIAAEKTGRTCLAIEIDPGYCDLAAARWERLTGEEAERIPRKR